MEERDYYKLPKSTPLMRFLWRAAGGDRNLLERATYSDQVKYMCLGGIIVATGLMAGLAGGYAFYTIFQPKHDIFSDVVDTSTAIKSTLFGIVWGLIIFNIDRFIVTSTGKGDGTEAITWDEIKSAIPRIIMGAIIAITISKPVEIRMFKTEIENKLKEEQILQKTDYEIKTRKNYERRLADVDRDYAIFQKTIDDYIKKINIKDSLYNIEIAKGQGSRGPGEGPIAKKIKEERESLNARLEKFKIDNKTALDNIDNRRKKIYEELDADLKENIEISNNLNGLLKRIEISHKLSPWITLFITLLFLAIELTPVFFKLMLIKTPYDYLAENRDELVKAQNGIEVRYDYYKDKVGQERHLTIYHEAQKLIHEKIKVTETQRELTEYALEQYKLREKGRIDNNLDDYIKGV